MVMRRETFLDQVQEHGKYATREEADRATRVVLALLGAHVVGECGRSWPPGCRRPTP